MCESKNCSNGGFMKSNISNEFHKIMQELEASIQDEEDLTIAKSQLLKLTEVFTEEIEKINEEYAAKFEKIEKKQSKLDSRVTQIEDTLDEIEDDIYEGEMGDDSFEFNITCPYCNNEFVAELDEFKDEIQCPECKNIIELDWDENCGCDDDGCDCCGHHCHEDNEDIDDNEDM